MKVMKITFAEWPSLRIGTEVPPAQEVSMKWLFAIAAFLMASTAAQAQYTFEYGGRTIRIDPDRGTVSIPGVYDNTGRRSKRSRNDQDSSRKQTPEQAKIDPQTPASASAPAPAEPAAAPAKASPEPSTATANVAPAVDTPTPAPASRRGVNASNSAGRCPRRQTGSATGCCDGSPIGASAARSGAGGPGHSIGEFTAWRLADGRERGQG